MTPFDARRCNSRADARARAHVPDDLLDDDEDAWDLSDLLEQGQEANPRVEVCRRCGNHIRTIPQTCEWDGKDCKP